jgi:branched-chain amino acid transport system permease protein
VATILQQSINGLSLGATYALLALGLAIVFSILHLVNFAHGEILTVSAYSMLGARKLGLPWIASLVVGVALAVVTAVAMERVAFRPVRHASPTTMLLTSFGLGIMIQAVFQVGVSPRPKAVPQPDWLSSAITVGGVRLQAVHLLTLAVTAVALIVLMVIMRRSLMGLAMRGASEDFDAVRLMSIRANRVIASAFAVSGFLAGIAAVLLLARSGSVTPSMGLMPVLMAFVANVIGGIGSLPGAVIGGFVLGFAEVMLRAWLPLGVSGFTTGFLFLFVAVLLLLRPEGLFGARTATRV